MYGSQAVYVNQPQQPLYLQVADYYRQRILSGDMPAGTRLPARHEIAAKHGVADGVAGQATRALVAEGFIESRPGAGMYVKARPEVRRLVRS
jgi:DNA-binding GntR family transcriptional regulator